MDPITAPALILPAAAGPDDLDRLCDAVRARLAAGDGAVVCDARALAGLGLTAVDLLARLELTARRARGRIRIRHAPPDLTALLLLTGLDFEREAAGVPSVPGALRRVEVERETEGREEAGGVQEGGEPGDPAG